MKGKNVAIIFTAVVIALVLYDAFWRSMSAPDTPAVKETVDHKQP